MLPVAAIILGLLAIILLFLPLGRLWSAVVLGIAMLLCTPKFGSISYVLFAALAFLFGGIDTLPLVVAAIIPGVILGLLAFNTQNIFYAFAISSAGMLFGSLVELLLEYFILGRNILAELKDSVLSYLAELAVLSPAGLTAEQSAQWISQIELLHAQILEWMTSGIGSIYILLAIAEGTIALLLIQRLCKRVLPLRQPFGFLAVPRSFGIAIAVMYVLSVLVASQWLPQMSGTVVSVQMLFSCAYILQGVSVLLFFLQTKRTKKSIQTLIIIAILLLLPVTYVALLVLGLTEALMHIRLRILKNSTPDNQPPPDNI